MLKNNKNTFWDEVLWGIVSIVCIAIGVFCIVKTPVIGSINETVIQLIGGVIGTVGIVLVPMVIYNLFHNELK